MAKKRDNRPHGNQDYTHLCKSCGDTDSDNFFEGSKSRCKECRLKKRRETYRKKVGPRKIKPYKCKKCGETNPDNFNKNGTKSMCGSCYSKLAKERYANFTPEEKDNYVQKQHEWQNKNFLKYRLHQANARARSVYNLPCEIDVEYLEELLVKQKNKCYYSGVEMKLHKAGKYTASLDRIDSTKGYVKGNVVFVLWIVNTMKNNLTEEEFFGLISSIYKNKVEN